MSDNSEQQTDHEPNNSRIWLVGTFVILAVIGTVFS